MKEELDALGLRAALKTSGSRGLHIVIPLPLRTPYEAGLLLAQLIATRVAEAHPRDATVERSVKARPPAAVYVDYLQNVKGKSVAGAYCVRAKPGATVSHATSVEGVERPAGPAGVHHRDGAPENRKARRHMEFRP